MPHATAQLLFYFILLYNRILSKPVNQDIATFFHHGTGEGAKPVPHCGPALLYRRTPDIDDFKPQNYHIADKRKKGGKPNVKDKDRNKC